MRPASLALLILLAPSAALAAPSMLGDARRDALPVPVPPPPNPTMAASALSVPAAMTVPVPPLDEGVQEAARLRALMRREVPRQATASPDVERRRTARARAAASAGGYAPERPELLVAVDRNPAVQEACVVLARPGDGRWEEIGCTKVSTGRPGTFDHYPTPLGVFRHTDAILGFRAEGTVNENGVRGLGAKGMRVWDLGWQWTTKGWGPVAEPRQIRLMMHATDPAILEGRMGRTASQGCVRIPSALNRFLDKYGVVDADYERVAPTDIRYRALLLADRAPSPLAGNAVVIYDSSER